METIDCLGHAYTVYGRWGLDIKSQQNPYKSIFIERKTVKGSILKTLLTSYFILFLHYILLCITNKHI